eukprot:TRINITY_DN5286_c0_g1_i3.p1 TRINITY_DN5286_c0_g1~~TRINITY_DN5286_c0_g1_i3.p1  ORF type:complete len:280 (-),score=24.50 TRINITY_DN5286_c0_g1_i3:163-975(-)
MSRVIVLSLAVLYSAALAAAQDPATSLSGWMAYAVGTLPSGTERLTHLEMKWKVSNNPRPSFAFFSPWFGADTTDNLFLIQPVNPWEGGQWNGYCENFIWQPVYNQDSPSFSVSPGQTMHGIMTYDASSDSYNVTQSCVETGATSSLQAKVPNGKKVTIPYVVYEKTWPCRYVLRVLHVALSLSLSLSLSLCVCVCVCARRLTPPTSPLSFPRIHFSIYLRLHELPVRSSGSPMPCLLRRLANTNSPVMLAMPSAMPRVGRDRRVRPVRR